MPRNAELTALRDCETSPIAFEHSEIVHRSLSYIGPESRTGPDRLLVVPASELNPDWRTWKYGRGCRVGGAGSLTGQGFWYSWHVQGPNNASEKTRGKRGKEK